MKRLMIGIGIVCVWLTGGASAAELHVVSSGGFAAAYKALAPIYEQKSGDHLTIAWGPSMGDTPDTVPSRLQRGEKLDVVIMVGYALGNLIKQGKVAADSRVDLALSGIGMAVRQGAPHPDVSSVETLKQTLLAARSIAYSDSASGVYVSTELFKTLGIAADVASKAHMIPADPVGGVVARGDAEIGFQQIAELKPVPGIELLGPLPKSVQKYTVYAGGIVRGSDQPEAAAAFLHFLASPEAQPAVVETGLEPMAAQ